MTDSTAVTRPEAGKFTERSNPMLTGPTIEVMIDTVAEMADWSALADRLRICNELLGSTFLTADSAARQHQRWHRRLTNRVHPAEARAGVEESGHADSNWSCVLGLQTGRSACPP